MKFQTHHFAANNYVYSLCWRGDELFDWVADVPVCPLQGDERMARRMFVYGFDDATASADGRFAVICKKGGTRGLLLDNGKAIRELSRANYCADDYAYPAHLFQDATGRYLLAHCPEKYCQLEIEDAATGEKLTASSGREPDDYFHSQISASPGGERLLVGGWVWHPWSEVRIYHVAKALADGSHLDKGTSSWPYTEYLDEEGTACWLDDDTLVMGSTNEVGDHTRKKIEENGTSPVPRGLAVVNVAKGENLRAFYYDEPPGTMFAVGKRHVLSLYRHPKLIDLETGAIVHVWSDIESGLVRDSISSVWQEDEPPMAFDRIRNRFAIAHNGKVTVISFGAGGA